MTTLDICTHRTVEETTTQWVLRCCRMQDYGAYPWDKVPTDVRRKLARELLNTLTPGERIEVAARNPDSVQLEAMRIERDTAIERARRAEEEVEQLRSEPFVVSVREWLGCGNVETIKEAIDRLRRDRDDALERARSCGDAADRIRGELEAAKTAAAGLREARDEAESELEEEVTRRTNSEIAMGCTDAECGRLRQRVAELERMRDGHTSMIHRAAVELESRKNELERRQEIINSLREQVSRLSSAVVSGAQDEVLRSQVAAMKLEIGQLTAERDAARAALSTIRATLDEAT